MINAQRQRVEQEMTSLVDDLDKSQLRKMQVKWVISEKFRAHFYDFYFSVLEKYAHLC